MLKMDIHEKQIDRTQILHKKKVSLEIQFCPERKKTPVLENTDYTKNTKPKIYYPANKIICDPSPED